MYQSSKLIMCANGHLINQCGVKKVLFVMRVLLFKITRSGVTKLLWFTAISVILQLATPAHAHDDFDHNSGVAEQYHVCSLCALDQPPKAIVGFDTPQISVRGIGSAQYTQDHSVDSSQPHSVRPPARAPPSQN